jgi:aminoglycoside phosphotransferase (APT) family kinase protein
MAVDLKVKFPVDDAVLSALHHTAFSPDWPDMDVATRPWASRLERHSLTWVGAFSSGRLVEATRSFRPPPGAVWFPWHGRDLGGPARGIGHCDVAPWNIVARDGLPVAFIDWETAGPVDPLVELAQLAWLNAKLQDDIVAEIEDLPPLADRARQLAAIVDAYGLTARQRRGFLDQIIEFAIVDTAWEADDAKVTPETTGHPITLWAMAWRARSAAWMIRHRRTLETALNRGA